MDVWIVAAAAGAGYVAQRLKNLTMRKHNSSDFLSENNNIVRPESQFGEDVCRQSKHACNDASLGAIASTSGFKGENLIELDNFASWGMVSDSNSLAGLFKKEDVEWDWDGRVSSDNDEVITSDSGSQSSSREVGFSYGFRRNRSRLTSRQVNSKSIKPRTSLESCLMAQLYKEHAEIEEYTYSVCPPRKPTVRPFLVSDGNRIISRAPHQSCSKPARKGEYKQSKDTHSQKNKTVFCVPRLPKTGKEQVLARSCTSKVVNGKQSNEQGSLDGTLLFLLGLTMGISYSFSGHKREIEKLNKSLKQTENLVQDLQEELEMKDVLTVKELAVEDYESPVHNDSYFDDVMQALSFEPKLDSSSIYYNDQNTEEESLRKIEADLKAELDRLGSNMNSSGLGELSNIAEPDQDFMPYAINGELRADLFGPQTEAYTERDESNSSTPQYPVCPKELSLRLHEVIQSRLEERVKELETELEYRQRKIKCIESEHIHSSEEVPGHSPSNHESPNAVDEPIVINLSGEALSAYNEVYDELAKLSESDEEESRCRNEEMFEDVENDVICSSRDESDDEMQRLLIRQIVEKARQGSPAVLKAQRAFLSTHEN